MKEIKLNKYANYQESFNINNIFGSKDRNLKVISSFYGVRISLTPTTLFIETEDEELVLKIEGLIGLLFEISNTGTQLSTRDIAYILRSYEELDPEDIYNFYVSKKEEIVRTYLGKPIYPKTISQVKLLEELNKNEIVITYGVAGVGKTFIALCDAIKEFKAGHYKKIILSRPVVEAGESLGYLPGDLKEKIDPYLIPLYDVLYDVMGKKTATSLIEEGVIEIAPLAYMRGRTLESAYVILDEAQNATISQIKLFLTRLGFNSKMVLTGDITQIDLINPTKSGLKYAIDRLDGIDQIKIFKFTIKDVVRNPLVEKIIMRLSDD